MKKENSYISNISIYLKKHFKTIIFIITLIIFIILSYLVFNNYLITIDNNTHTYLVSIRNNILTNIFLIITNLANPYFLIILNIILLISIKKKKIPLLISLNLICSFLINQTTKLIFAKPRPININIIEESGFSFPSGHSMISLAFYGFITYLIYQRLNNKKHKRILIISFILIILLIGLSRIYLGVHYLSDVIGGFLLGIIYLFIYIKLINNQIK